MPLQRTRVALTGRAAELLPLLERLEALAPAHSLAVASGSRKTWPRLTCAAIARKPHRSSAARISAGVRP